MDLQLLLPKVIDLAKAAGNFIRTEQINFSKERLEFKGANDLVSYVDREGGENSGCWISGDDSRSRIHY